MKTEFGVPVKKIRLLNGHNLVYKIPRADTTGSLKLPDTYVRKSVRNLIAIKGLVIKVTEPYRPKVSKIIYVYNSAYNEQLPRSIVKDCKKPIEAVLTPGEFIVYNSYNVGMVAVEGLPEPLVIVRDIDLFVAYQAAVDGTVELGDAIYQTQYT
jgi:hypothetical protein